MEKPIKRNRIRLFLGKEFYIIKRKLNWLQERKDWAKIHNNISLKKEVYTHKSLILRPLKNVDMYLQHNKRTNLELAIDKLNNVVLNPNEVFSFWKLVGRPTKYKGYLEGLVLNQGKIDKSIGGGLCQLGNLLFWIVAHSPLDVTERYRHSFDVFPDRFQIKLWLDEKYLYGSLVSEKEINSSFQIIEKNHRITPESWGGHTRHNQIFKQEIVEEEIIEENLLVENHAIMMYNPLID